VTKVDSEKLRETQVFTPAWVTNAMLDMLDQDVFTSQESYFFEPSCGDGQMLVVLLDRIFEALFKKYDSDPDKALADTLHKFFAIELDETLVAKARMRVYEWAVAKLDRSPTELEAYLIARAIQQNLECEDFFNIFGKPERQPIKRKLMKGSEGK
jgi:hypothetical protein|tara:strand:- start:6771 stop:7235 length:465 start_codon:yes stop_codon:yes gene_type:complete